MYFDCIVMIRIKQNKIGFDMNKYQGKNVLGKLLLVSSKFIIINNYIWKTKLGRTKLSF